jgi:hypothetical protein
MKSRAVLPVLASILLGALPASPDAVPPTPSVPAGVEAPADAGAVADADGGTGAVAKDESFPFVGPVPTEKSKPPKAAEWQAARDLGGSTRLSSCSVRTVREWMRVRCEIERAISVDLVAGNQNDVYFSLLPGGGACTTDEVEGRVCADAVEVVFPIRRGDRRFFQIGMMVFNVGGGSYQGVSLVRETFALISETWVDDDPGPIVTFSQP